MSFMSPQYRSELWKKTELLFLALFTKMLNVGGRCASIVPDGVLFGSSTAHKAIRRELVDNQKLTAVISMPSGVFKPYAGVSTAILIFTKTNAGGTDNVWFYDMQADGYSLDDKRSLIAENDIPDIIERFNNLEKENERERTMDAYNLDYIDLDTCVGKWQMPFIHKTDFVPEDLMSFNYMLNTDAFEKGIHFYVDDYQFERIWNDPDKYLDRVSQFACCLTPDFSMYTEMPLAMMVWNKFRSQLIGQIMQDYGITVIPTLQWCKEDSFEFCFEGIEAGGTVSVSTIGVKKEDSASEIWFKGMDEAIRRLKPSHVVVYGGDIGYKFDCPVTYIDNHNTERMR